MHFYFVGRKRSFIILRNFLSSVMGFSVAKRIKKNISRTLIYFFINTAMKIFMYESKKKEKRSCEDIKQLILLAQFFLTSMTATFIVMQENVSEGGRLLFGICVSAGIAYFVTDYLQK